MGAPRRPNAATRAFAVLRSTQSVAGVRNGRRRTRQRLAPSIRHMVHMRPDVGAETRRIGARGDHARGGLEGGRPECCSDRRLGHRHSAKSKNVLEDLTSGENGVYHPRLPSSLRRGRRAARHAAPSWDPGAPSYRARRLPALPPPRPAVSRAAPRRRATPPPVRLGRHLRMGGRGAWAPRGVAADLLETIEPGHRRQRAAWCAKIGPPASSRHAFRRAGRGDLLPQPDTITVGGSRHGRRSR